MLMKMMLLLLIMIAFCIMIMIIDVDDCTYDCDDDGVGDVVDDDDAADYYDYAVVYYNCG